MLPPVARGHGHGHGHESTVQLSQSQLPSLSHFVVFNPTLAMRRPRPPVPQPTGADSSQVEVEVPSSSSQPESQWAGVATTNPSSPKSPKDQERDRDLEDDLREAAQIVFYTSRESGGVSRDRMLRQVGLAKGLMGFADMVVVDPDEATEDDAPVYWAVHAQYQRLIVYSPEPNWFIYICISLPRDVKDTKDAAAPAKPAQPDPPALSDCMLVEGLRRGYDDFCLLHANLGSHLPSTPAFASLLERYWTRFAFSYEAAYLTPGPSSPLLTWLGGWPADVDDAPLREVLDALVDHPGSGAGLVTPKRPLMLAGTAPRGRGGAALTRFLLSILATGLPPSAPPAHKPERHSLGFGFGRRKPAPTALRPTPIKPPAVAKIVAQDEPRKTSWGLASPLAWVGFAASEPASRTSTPAPAPTPTPTVGATSKEDKADTKPEKDMEAKAEPRATPLRPASASHKPRWPSLGISFGDAVGNVGAVFGLSSSPKPESRLQEGGGSGAATPSEAEEDGKVEKDEPAKAVTKATETEATPDATSDEAGRQVEPAPELEVTQSDGAAAGAEQAEPLTSDAPTSTVAEAEGDTTPELTELPSPQPEPHADPTDSPSAEAPATSTDASTPGPAETTAPAEASTEPAEAQSQASTPSRPSTPAEPADSDAASIATGVSQTEVALPDLAAAVDSDVDMAWDSRSVYLGGRRRLFWVIRERILLFYLAQPEDDGHLPSAVAALSVFSTYAASPFASASPVDEGRKDRAERPPDTTIYHTPDITDMSGPLDGGDSGTLAALRDLVLGGVGEVLAQTPGGRFVIAKRADQDGGEGKEGELYAVTGRRDASLTDAERVVREFALLRPEFT